ADSVGQRLFGDLFGKALADRRLETLRIVDAVDEMTRRQDDRSRDDRTGQGSTARLVHTGHVAKATRPELLLHGKQRGGPPTRVTPPRSTSGSRVSSHARLPRTLMLVPLANPRRLPAQIAQVIELRAANL